MMFVSFIYILLAAAMAGFAYWDRINRDDYDIDHCFDVLFFSSRRNLLPCHRSVFTTVLLFEKVKRKEE